MDFLIFFTFGTFVGSFFNVVIYRMPRDESIIKPRSHCPACKASIPFYRNIPLVSFILQAGKCANCQGRNIIAISSCGINKWTFLGVVILYVTISRSGYCIFSQFHTYCDSVDRCKNIYGSLGSHCCWCCCFVVCSYFWCLIIQSGIMGYCRRRIITRVHDGLNLACNQASGHGFW